MTFFEIIKRIESVLNELQQEVKDKDLDFGISWDYKIYPKSEDNEDTKLSIIFTLHGEDYDDLYALTSIYVRFVFRDFGYENNEYDEYDEDNEFMFCQIAKPYCDKIVKILENKKG